MIYTIQNHLFIKIIFISNIILHQKHVNNLILIIYIDNLLYLCFLYNMKLYYIF